MISASSGISFGLQADLPADNPSHAHRMVCACALLGRLDDRLHMIQSQRNDKSASDLDKEAEGTNTERSYAFNRDQTPLVQQHMLTCAKESMLLWVFTWAVTKLQDQNHFWSKTYNNCTGQIQHKLDIQQRQLPPIKRMLVSVQVKLPPLWPTHASWRQQLTLQDVMADCAPCLHLDCIHHGPVWASHISQCRVNNLRLVTLHVR